MRYVFLIAAFAFGAVSIYQLTLPNPVLWFTIAIYTAFSSALAFKRIFKKIHLAIGLAVMIFIGVPMTSAMDISPEKEYFQQRLILLLACSIWMLLLLLYAYIRDKRRVS